MPDIKYLKWRPPVWRTWEGQLTNVLGFTKEIYFGEPNETCYLRRSDAQEFRGHSLATVPKIDVYLNEVTRLTALVINGDRTKVDPDLEHFIVELMHLEGIDGVSLLPDAIVINCTPDPLQPMRGSVRSAINELIVSKWGSDAFDGVYLEDVVEEEKPTDIWDDEIDA